MKTDLFQSCGHCWVFQICWRIECSTFTASSFRIWNSSTGIPSPPLALFVVMLSKAHLTSHSRMSGSMCYDDLNGWDAGGVGERSKREGIYAHIYVSDMCVCVCVCVCVYIYIYDSLHVQHRNQHTTIKQLYSNYFFKEMMVAKNLIYSKTILQKWSLNKEIAR